MAKREKTEMEAGKKGTSKYFLKWMWRKSNVNGWPLPCCTAEEVEACRRAMQGK